MRSRTLVIGAALLAGGSLGCSKGAPATKTALATPVARALDSCAAISPEPSATDSSRVRTRRALGGAIRTLGMYSMFVPEGVHLSMTDSVAGTFTLTWPGCNDCRFGVTIQRDSGIGLDARIARLVASQRAVDSANASGGSGALEFDEIDGPPVPVTTRGGHGYLIRNTCGDCAASELMLARPGYVATIGFGGGDQEPYLGRYLCEMDVVARTFAWRQ